jgi:hypothetical protein
MYLGYEQATWSVLTIDRGWKGGQMCDCSFNTLFCLVQELMLLQEKIRRSGELYVYLMRHLHLIHQTGTHLEGTHLIYLQSIE